MSPFKSLTCISHHPTGEAHDKPIALFPFAPRNSQQGLLSSDVRTGLSARDASLVTLPTEINIPRLDHIGIAVESIEAALPLYRDGLECEASEPIEAPEEQVRLVMVSTGESRVELLEATSADSPIARFIRKRGQGIHHLAMKVRDLDGVVERLKKSGRRLVTETVQRGGAGDYRYVFVHPKSAGGVLLELIED